MPTDNTLASALVLVAGGAAGYAAARYLRGPKQPIRVSTSTNQATTSAGAAAAAGMTRPPRASAIGPSGIGGPVDPYATPSTPRIVSAPTRPYAGPSGPMRPIDPYEPSSASALPMATTPTAGVAAPQGPITSPSQVAAVGPTLDLGRGPEELGRPTGPSRGPITSPSQSPSANERPRRAFATSPRVRRFDPVFEQYRGGLPIEYVRALVERESDGDPAARAGRAIGLMQIVPVVLADYNKRHGTSYTGVDLLRPTTNVAIGCELLHLIIAGYRTHHPKITTLQADWNNPQFVALLTFGWNAGFSEAGGVGRVARYLEQLGAVDISIDQVASHAKLAGASRHLENPAKLAWCKSVVALYQRERTLAQPSMSAWA